MLSPNDKQDSRTPVIHIRARRLLQSDQPYQTTVEHLPSAESNKETIQNVSAIQPNQSKMDYMPVMIIILKILMELCQTLNHTHNIDANSTIKTLANVTQQCTPTA